MSEQTATKKMTTEDRLKLIATEIPYVMGQVNRERMIQDFLIVEKIHLLSDLSVKIMSTYDSMESSADNVEIERWRKIRGSMMKQINDLKVSIERGER